MSFVFCLCVWLYRIAQMLVGSCRAETLHRTVTRPSPRREIRSSLTAVTPLIRPEPTTSREMLRRRSGVCVWLCMCVLECIESNPRRQTCRGKNVPLGLFWSPADFGVSWVFASDLTHLFSLRHLQREMENQKAQANRFQLQMRRLDEDIKQNDLLLRRTHIEQKTTKVMLSPLTNQYWSRCDARIPWNADSMFKASVLCQMFLLF